ARATTCFSPARNTIRATAYCASWASARARAAPMTAMMMAADPTMRPHRPAMAAAAMPVAVRLEADRCHAPEVPESNRNQDDEPSNNEEFPFRDRADPFSRTGLRPNAFQAGPHRSSETDADAARGQGR